MRMRSVFAIRDNSILQARWKRVVNPRRTGAARAHKPCDTGLRQSHAKGFNSAVPVPSAPAAQGEPCHRSPAIGHHPGLPCILRGRRLCFGRAAIRGGDLRCGWPRSCRDSRQNPAAGPAGTRSAGGAPQARDMLASRGRALPVAAQRLAAGEQNSRKKPICFQRVPLLPVNRFF